MSALPESAPPFEHSNLIQLDSVKDSKVTGVSVYAGRAEVTRFFKFNVKTGQNQVSVLGLPSVLDHDSLRVEGRGAATIHDVTISTIPPPRREENSPELSSLLARKKSNEKAHARATKALSSLETYMSSLKAETLDVSKLGDAVKNYEATANELDDKITTLEEEKLTIEKQIVEETERLHGPTGNEKLNVKVSIGVFAGFEGSVEIALIYAVNRASWSAAYDIRVDMQAEDKPVSLIYKASITQDTGEDWNDVPLTLETATPTVGIDVPTLLPWTLSTYKPMPKGMFSAKKSRGRVMSGAPMLASPAMPAGLPPAGFDSFGGYEDANSWNVEHRTLQVSSKGNLSATFAVPGLMNVPSDNVGHNVTIVKLELDADMSWVCVPKQDTRVRLKAKIKNASEYTFLAGPASVYVDGSFISKSDVPLVSPEESFDCPLGLDSSIRVTYHPLSKKVSKSGFYTKSKNHSFTQRISVHNTKPSTKGSQSISLKIVDQIPISENSEITVKLVQPGLTMPTADGVVGSTTNEGSGKTTPKYALPLTVSGGVSAMWDGADEVGQTDTDVESLGKEGRIAWICSVPPQGKVGVTLQWEVTAPVNMDVYGL
ncbi:hypothetical protein CPC08DRAFT_708583 [Agrocybe pediades]|nr:hypothetical protein CPC08DRAFT_708583 [Agrocybe pediades]